MRSHLPLLGLAVALTCGCPNQPQPAQSKTAPASPTPAPSASPASPVEVATPSPKAPEAEASPEAAATPAPIPIASAPSFDLPEGDLPPLFHEARVATALPIANEEQKAFSEAFRSELFKSGGFKRSGEEADFVAQALYEAKLVSQPLEGRPEVDRLIKVVASVRLVGSATRGSKTFSVKLKHDQPSSEAQAPEMRVAHAQVVGRLLAQKLISTLAQARGPAVRFEYTLVFKSYDRALARDVVDVVAGLPGVEEEHLSQRAGRGGVLVLMLSSGVPQAKLAKAIGDALEDDDLAADYSSPEASVLIFTSK